MFRVMELDGQKVVEPALPEDVTIEMLTRILGQIDALIELERQLVTAMTVPPFTK